MTYVSPECSSAIATGLGWTGLNIANPSQFTLNYLLKKAIENSLIPEEPSHLIWDYFERNGY